MSKIYYENTYTDENGIEWLSLLIEVINQYILF